MAARAVRSRSIARGRSHLWPPEVHWRSPVTACSALVDGARECHVTLALAFSTHKRDAEGSLTLPNTLFCHTCRPARRAVCGLLAVAGQSSRLSTLTIVTGQASRPARQPRSKPRCNNSSYGRSAPLRGASNTSGISGAISRNVEHSQKVSNDMQRNFLRGRTYHLQPVHSSHNALCSPITRHGLRAHLGGRCKA